MQERRRRLVVVEPLASLSDTTSGGLLVECALLNWVAALWRLLASHAILLGLHVPHVGRRRCSAIIEFAGHEKGSQYIDSALLPARDF